MPQLILSRPAPNWARLSRVMPLPDAGLAMNTG